MNLIQSHKRRYRISTLSTASVNPNYRFVLLAALLPLLLLPRMTMAAGALDIDGFNPDVNSGVRAISQQTDGKVLIGGFFDIVNGTSRNRIARLNADGSLDTGFVSFKR
jgi:hypothetical protein